MRRLGWIPTLGLAWLVVPAHAQDAVSEDPAAPVEGEAEAATGDAAGAEAVEQPEKPEMAIALDLLLQKVRAKVAKEREEDRQREAVFEQARAEQARLLRQTEAAVRAEEQQGEYLDTAYGENEVEIEVLGERLTERLGQMGELFGVVRLVSTDMSAQSWESLTSAGIENRTEVLDRLGRNTGLPSTEDLERLWFEVQREMTEQGRVVRQSLPVVPWRGKGGEAKTSETVEVVRVGPFTAFSDAGYLQWERKLQQVRGLGRQPPPRYLDTALDYLEYEGEDFQFVAIDPSRGVLLEALTDTPSIVERVRQGGYVGYTIIALGIAALLLGALRLAVLSVTGRRVEEQALLDRPDDRNPLGRLLGAYEANKKLDIEALEQKLDEVVLRECNGVERHIWIVQTISIIAPLLGLLGTVTGMIQTFQAITLFGAGDPKMMASGISEALVTTTLGLVIAIPLVLLHALLTSRTRRISDVLEERSASLRADRMLEGHAP